MNAQQLNTLIERYFDGSASVAEERLLRDELASTRLTSPAIDEARAVMSYSLAQRKEKSTRGHKRHVWLKAAASVAVLAVVATIGYRLTLNDTVAPECVAYVDGQRITDSNTVIDMMFKGLSNVADAAEESQSQTISSLENLVSAMDQLDSF